MPKKKSSVSPKLRKCLGYWVSILNLTDWKFRVEEADKKVLEEGNALAYCKLIEQHKIAEIYLPDLSKCDKDTEFAVVHELLHVVFWNNTAHHYKSQQDKDLFEQALNSTTEAFLKLKK